MSHDTDKLIRQLSLVAFLMAERRPLTARDVKGNVEGYSEMSDEAFARRFYSDRAELRDLGVPLQSQRDEFTGEELYTLRSENYFLPKLELTDDELAALQTCFYLLEGKFAYAEPLRLALQNLALGRPTLTDEVPSATAVRVEMRDPDYSAEMPGRLAKLETAISKQRTIRFAYRAMTSGKETDRTLNPYGLLHDRGVWYVIGADHNREAIRTFRVSRIRGDIRFATRRERDFKLPADFDIELYRGRSPWQVGDARGEARIDVAPETAWWVERAFGRELEDGLFVTEYASLPMLASWVLRQDGRAIPREPDDLRREVAESLRRVRARHEGPPSKPAREVAVRQDDAVAERSSGPVTPERFGLLQALLAYLLAACGDQKDAVVPAAEVVERFQIPAEELEEHLSLLNLVNFGGGCY
ncbi:MAG TPA: WYL domain-containing protein, partial [Gaiellaceae bacterium]|nr:WYL domain-containing protein [Gaiellaceae bacterium]